jgi:CBS domain-containing protein
MPLGEYCNREVIVIDGEESVLDAAQLMRQHHVGDVVVVAERHGKRVPIGIVTDRDLVVEVMAPELAPEELAVRDIVVESPVVLHEDASLFAALQMMRGHAVRRVPVVGRDGELVGIITVDDVLGLLAEAVGDLAALVERQPKREAARRP